MTQQITVYQTDVDGLYLHAVTANELAQQPGSFNIPYGARLSAPPVAASGQVAQAIGDSWTLVEDWRASQFYRIDDASEYALGTAILLGDQVVRFSGWGPVPAWLTRVAPPAPDATWTGSGWAVPVAPEV
ncbi:hypothetical protein ANDO1_3045 [plant metagenome]|uniref:Phage tail protein n=1 Tax=plant metagenome TaxID=1297885 RepID=A0A484QDC5_9ZZZZ